ncbi:MAG: divalent-cation tolerance protein CutA [Rickettsiaceae bacterium H1]|nr:divalent-cation tolerance protein CutA [Rickettsiaceae bacterium H1]
MEIVYITTPNFELAEKIATNLAEDNLVACANLFDSITSIYKWEEKLQKKSEVVIIAKTLAEKVNDIISRVKTIHTYDCPLIFSVSTSNVNIPFLEWVKKSVGM